MEVSCVCVYCQADHPDRLSSSEQAIDELVNRAHATADDKGFWEHGFLTVGVNTNEILAKLMLIVTEVAEAAEAVREGDEDNYSKEMADIAIRLFDLAGGTDVALGDSIVLKMNQNERRDHMHGGKLA